MAATLDPLSKSILLETSHLMKWIEFSPYISTNSFTVFNPVPLFQSKTTT